MKVKLISLWRAWGQNSVAVKPQALTSHPLGWLLLRTHKLTPLQKTANTVRKQKKGKPWDLGGNIKSLQLLCKMAWLFFKKLSIQLPCDPAVPLLGIDPKEEKAGTWMDIGALLFSSITHHSQKLKTTQVSTDGWMGKHCGIHTEWILFSIKMEGKFDTWHDMGESWRHYSKLASHKTTNTIPCTLGL